MSTSSTLDFFAGRQAAGLAAGREIGEWERFSSRLQGRLQQAEFDFAKAEAGRIGFAHLFKTVLEELRRVDPANPLLQKETQLKILGAKVAEKAAEMGYLYDPGSGSLVEKR